MHDRTTPEPAIEPYAVTERNAAAMLGVSPRTFRNFIARGDVTAIRIPGVRRILFDTKELRALLEKWKRATPEQVA